MNSRSGQSLIFVTLATSAIFGLTALVFDFGSVYRAQSILDASTQAATLAGAQAMAQPGATLTTTTAAVTSYSSVAGKANAAGILSGVSLVSGYPSLSCRSTLTTSFNVSCYGPSSSNSLVVKQQATVPLYFLRMFGSSSATLTSAAAASMKGSSSGPFNVAIILDTTQSMSSIDLDSNCINTRISCAMKGIQVLLQHMAPCLASLTTCGAVTNGNVQNSVDRASLFVFPPVTTASASSEYSCTGTVSTAPYASPLPAASTYQIVPASSDYRGSNTTSTLNTNSHIVDVVKGKTGTPCLQVKGGYGTYYAQAIYAAQTYLVAQQALYPGSKNAIILVGDGDAGASSSNMPGAATSGGVYMATHQQCQQAVTAAAAATAAGTRVYSVAYGAVASGCSTDTSPAITPCQTMQQMASTPGYFFSDYTASGASSTCVSASQPVTNLSQIFEVIAGDLSVAKLIPRDMP